MTLSGFLLIYDYESTFPQRVDFVQIPFVAVTGIWDVMSFSLPLPSSQWDGSPQSVPGPWQPLVRWVEWLVGGQEGGTHQHLQQLDPHPGPLWHWLWALQNTIFIEDSETGGEIIECGTV